MTFYGMLRRVVLVLTDVSGERIASIFRLERNQRARNQREQVAADFFYPEDGGDTLPRNVVSHKNFTTQHRRKRHFL
jgi:hypothetical protein